MNNDDNKKGGQWIVNTDGKRSTLTLLNGEAAGTVNVALVPVSICHLFSPNLLFPNHDTTRVLYRMYSQELETEIWKAVEKFSDDIAHQCRVMTFHESKFDLSEKTRRSEAQRTAYRIDTRLYQSVPELKTQVNFLRPSFDSANIQQQKRIQFREVCTVEDIRKLDLSYDTYHKTPYPFQFRGSLPVSIMKSDIPEMYNNQQFLSVAPKTNGLRFFLLGVTFFHEQMMVFMDRALKLYLVPLDVPAIWFHGTILDGELVSRSDGGYAFIVYDAWQCNGVPLGQESYLNRLQIPHLLLEQWKSQVKAPLFDIRVKSVYTVEQVPDMLMNELNGMDHLLDGLIITAVEPSAPLGRASQKIYKYKVGNENTIDCLVQHKQAQTLHLLSFVKGHEYALWAMIDNLERAQKTDLKTTCHELGVDVDHCNNWEKLAASLHGKVVECAYQQDTKSWKLKSVREKSDANLLRTAEKTFQNIQENLTLNEIFPEDYVRWPIDVRKKLIQWESGFQKMLQVNWTMVPLLNLGKVKHYIPIRPLAPVKFKELNRILQF